MWLIIILYTIAICQMDAELRIIRLSKVAKLWTVILYTAAELQFVRLLKVKHKRKLRLFIITTIKPDENLNCLYMLEA